MNDQSLYKLKRNTMKPLHDMHQYKQTLL